MSTAETLPCGRWQHVAFVADGTVLHLYHNGVEVNSGRYQGITRELLPKGLGIGCCSQSDEIGVNPKVTTSGTDGLMRLPFSTARSVPSKCGNCIRGQRLPRNRRPGDRSATSGPEPQGGAGTARQSGGKEDVNEPDVA